MRNNSWAALVIVFGIVGIAIALSAGVAFTLLSTNVNTGATQSASGLEIYTGNGGEELTIVRGGADGEVLKWNTDNTIGWGVDATSEVTGAMANSFETVDVPVGTDAVATSATDTLTLTSPLGTMSISGSDPDTIGFDVLTAPALSANGANCAANEFNKGVDAAGAAESCATLVDVDVPNNITIDLASTATAFAADPADCAADTKADAIDAEGDLTCSAVDTGDIVNDTVGFLDLDYSNTLAGDPALGTGECIFSSGIGGGIGGFICESATADTNEQAYVFPAVNGANTTEFIVVDATQVTDVEGRNLTVNSGVLHLDEEIYTDNHTLWFENPTAADDFQTIWVALGANYTFTRISCESDQTVNFDLQIDDGTPAGVNGSDIACTTFASDALLSGDVTMLAAERLDLAITSVSGTPTWVSISWTVTKDD